MGVMDGYTFYDTTLGAFHGGGSRGGARGGFHVARGGRVNSSFRPGRSFAALHGFGSASGFGGGRGVFAGRAARLRALHFWRQQMLNGQSPYGGGGASGGGGGDQGGGGGGEQPGSGDSGGLTLQQLEQEIQQLEQQLAAQGGGGQPGGGGGKGGGGEESEDGGGMGAFHPGERFYGRGFDARRPRYEWERPHPGYPGYGHPWPIPPRRHIDWGGLFDRGIRAWEERRPHPAPVPINRSYIDLPIGPTNIYGNPPVAPMALNTPTDANPPADGSMGEWWDGRRWREGERRQPWQGQRRNFGEDRRFDRRWE